MSPLFPSLRRVLYATEVQLYCTWCSVEYRVIRGGTSTGGSEREGEILAPAREWPRRPAPRLGVAYRARAVTMEPATARPLSMRSRSFPDSHASRAAGAATVPQLSLDRQIDGHTD